ncbi:hypothetical protein NIE88_04995 [Sporolactobacillus shoreicorticis]|uniref:Uncharacterized protein n=1 Tax=Sporolactobacillus shoreicorticis TaxID=1923877 RepID=A0ABW5RYC1_9BACL|nr:hypothetical protein [Sporolactobacillus shoreicorticis]MCO7125131.1 hypothetical protein [Sporolactobacillus shoreicorticis]
MNEDKEGFQRKHNYSVDKESAKIEVKKVINTQQGQHLKVPKQIKNTKK